MDILQLTYSGTQIYHEVNSMHHDEQKQKTGEKTSRYNFCRVREKERESRFIVGEGRVSLFRILSCAGTADCHLCVIFHPWHP